MISSLKKLIASLAALSFHIFQPSCVHFFQGRISQRNNVSLFYVLCSCLNRTLLGFLMDETNNLNMQFNLTQHKAARKKILKKHPFSLLCCAFINPLRLFRYSGATSSFSLTFMKLCITCSLQSWRSMWKTRIE